MSMNTRIWWAIVIVLAVVIVVMLVLLVMLPTPAHAPAIATTTGATTATSSSVPAPTNQPLHARVVVTAPKSGQAVGQTFAISGEAPGNWYFEASFPIQVRDADNNKMGQAIAQAQSDWMTSAQVPFKASMTLDTVYHGPATLVLLRDNPSGMPENDDSLEVPIVIQ